MDTKLANVGELVLKTVEKAARYDVPLYSTCLVPVMAAVSPVAGKKKILTAKT